MTSAGPIDVPSSPRSDLSGALQSYSRSQSLVASSHIAPEHSVGSYASLPPRDEEAAAAARPAHAFNDIDEDYEDNMPTPTMEYSGTPFVADLQWDDDRTAAPSPLSGSSTPRAFSFPRHQHARSVSTVRGEKTPLLAASKKAAAHAPLRRQASDPKFVLETGQRVARKSTFSQSLFNSMAILLGIGLLSEPLAFSYAGWLGGTILITFYGWLTCYTAKILARLIRADSALRTYTDIARKAFGPRATGATSALFFLELFTLAVVLVTLFADSLHEVAPAYSSDAYKALAFVILLPTVFLPLSLLSYASLVGVTSTLFIILVVLYDGATKHTAPGSLWDPAPTQLGAQSPLKLTLAFGLFMAGFSGHAVIPSLALDMDKPEEFDKVMNIAFTATTFLYALMGAAGYLMFGSAVSQEISQDLLRTPGFPLGLNKLCVWLLVVVPLTKFALAARPLNITLELLLGLAAPEDARWRGAVVLERTALVAAVAAVAVLVPDFSASMAFLGSFSAFVLCVLGPIMAKAGVEGRIGVLDSVLLVVSTAMAAAGTAASFFAVAD